MTFENRKPPAFSITEEGVGDLQFIAAMEKIEHYGGLAISVKLHIWEMRFWNYLVPLLGSLQE